MGPIRTAGAVARDTTRTWASTAVAASLAVLSLAGCSSSSADQAAYVCPGVTIVRDLSLISRFDGPAEAGSPLFSGEIVGTDGECSFDETAVQVTLQVSMVYDRPQGMGATAEPVEFFVAVARPDGTVVGKEAFATAVDFRDNETRSGFREEVELTVPLPEGPASGAGYTVFVGYQLTAEELEYNRQRRQ